MSGADYVYSQLIQLAQGDVRTLEKAIRGDQKDKALRLLRDIEQSLRNIAVHAASIPRK